MDEKSRVTPAAGTSSELDVQNKWEENTAQHHTTILGANSLLIEQKERYDIITDEEWYILVIRYVVVV